MTRLTITLLILLGIAEPAAAQVMTGPRVEATIGYDRLASHDDFEDLPDAFDGARLGGALGYDVAVAERLTLGVEAGAGWTLGSAKITPLARDRLRQSLGRDLDLSVRLGLRLAPSTLGYIKAGYANSRFDIRYDGVVIGGYERVRSHVVRGGLRLGAGLEQSLGNRLYAKAEYRWTNYGSDAAYIESPTRSQLLLGFGARF